MKLEHNSYMNDKKMNAEILEGVESWMSCFTSCCLHAQDKTLPLGDETAAFRHSAPAQPHHILPERFVAL
jgi:hypothetical protein